MTDSEIYALSGNVISSITSDLNSGIYKDLNGSLSVSWSTSKSFNAWAESLGDVFNSPQHKIGLHYELARQIYRDAEEYCEFVINHLPRSNVQLLLNNITNEPNLPSEFTLDDCRRNMFLGALTFVYFHELGHLFQEHGYIRSILCKTNIHPIQECSVNDSSSVSGRTSAIYHVTELAADFEAINFCIMELVRHFKGRTLIGSIYMFICGISCVFYRFHGVRALAPESIPIGSHPNPIIRMEINLPHLFEFMDIEQVRLTTKYDLGRAELVGIFSKAAYSGAFFHLWKQDRQTHVPQGYLITGIQQRPEVKEYFKIIINTWDEIESKIKQVRRHDNPFGFLQFSDDLRKLID